MLSLLAAAVLAQAPLTLKSDGGVLTVDSTARCRLIGTTDGTELHDGAFVPLAEATLGGVTQAATALKTSPGGFELTFGGTGLTATLTAESRPEAIVFRLKALKGPPPQSIRFLSLSTRGLPSRGRWLNVRSNGKHAVCVLGLSPRVDAAPWGGHGLGATVYPETGMIGEGAALVISGRAAFLSAVRKAEQALDLPSPTLGGEWAKTSKVAQGSYLFTDLTQANIDQTIRYAKMGGFEAILIYASTWASSNGTYALHPTHYPDGEAGLLRVVQKCNAAGLRVGLHVLTSMISKHDPLAVQRDPRLLADATATLAAPVTPSDTTLTLREPLDKFPVTPAHYGNVPGGTDVRVGVEWVQYGRVDLNGRRLLDCKRGAKGSTAAGHAAGQRVEHLAERYNSYLANLRSDLLPQIASRLSGVINRCGIGMVYFDGGENASVNGPYWYWVGQMQEAVLKSVKRDIVVQGSGMTHWTWHWFTRGTCDDFAALAPAAYLDVHKIAQVHADYRRDFLPAELGWWAFLADDPAWPGTTLEDVDAYGARMMAYNSAVSVETTLDQLKANPRTEGLLARLAEWETLRRRPGTLDERRSAMQTGTWTLPGPTRVARRTADLPSGKPTSFDNPFGPQRPIVSLKLLPMLERRAATWNQTPLSLASPPAGAFKTGWSALRHPIRADLTRSRALEVEIEAPASTHGGVLNVQLEADGLVYRDHLLDLLPGRHTYTLARPSAERVLREFLDAWGIYDIKASVYAFDYAKVRAVNMRWMTAPGPGPVTVHSIRALHELTSTITRPILRIEGSDIEIPVTLTTGETITVDPGGAARVLDSGGRQRSSLALTNWPVLPKGPFDLTLFVSGSVRVEATVETRAVPATSWPHRDNPLY